MSDMSGLSHEYASTTDFSRQINEAVLLLKKRYLRDSKGIDAERLDEANEFIWSTVQTLLHRLKDAPIPDAVDVPEDVIARIESKHRGSLDYLIEDLKQLERLFAQHAALGAENLEFLDSICEAADASASATFRKLWRR